MASLRNLRLVRRVLARFAQILRHVTDWADRHASETPNQQPDLKYLSPPAHWLERVRAGAPQLLIPPALGGVPEQQAQSWQHDLVEDALSAPKVEQVRQDASRWHATPAAGNVPQRHEAPAERFANTQSPPRALPTAALTEVVAAPRRTIARVDESTQLLRGPLPGRPADEREKPAFPKRPVSVQAESPGRAAVSHSSPPAVRIVPVPAPQAEPFSPRLAPPAPSATSIQQAMAPESATSAVWPDLPFRNLPSLKPGREHPAPASQPGSLHLSLPPDKLPARPYAAFAEDISWAADKASQPPDCEPPQPGSLSSPGQNIWPPLPPAPAPVQPAWEGVLQRHLREAALLAEQRGEITLWNA